jgi:hypothetical protein
VCGREYFPVSKPNIFLKPRSLSSSCLPTPYVNYVYKTVGSEFAISADIMRKL